MAKRARRRNEEQAAYWRAAIRRREASGQSVWSFASLKMHAHAAVLAGLPFDHAFAGMRGRCRQCNERGVGARLAVESIESLFERVVIKPQCAGRDAHAVVGCQLCRCLPERFGNSLAALAILAT